MDAKPQIDEGHDDGPERLQEGLFFGLAERFIIQQGFIFFNIDLNYRSCRPIKYFTYAYIVSNIYIFFHIITPIIQPIVDLWQILLLYSFCAARLHFAGCH